MRKITVATLKKRVHYPDHPKDHHVDLYKMEPGTAWKWDVYGNHHVVQVDESICKKAEHVDGCIMTFDGRWMAIFKAPDASYLQPMAEDARAKEDRLGSKRKKILRKPRKEAPGVAPQALNWENQEDEPSDRKRPRREARPAASPDGAPRAHRRAGPRKGLRLEI